MFGPRGEICFDRPTENRTLFKVTKNGIFFIRKTRRGATMCSSWVSTFSIRDTFQTITLSIAS